MLTSVFKNWREYDSKYLGDWYTHLHIHLFSIRVARSVLKKAIDVGSCLIKLQSFVVEKPLNCNNKLCFGELSKYFCTPRFSVYPDHIELPDLECRPSYSLL